MNMKFVCSTAGRQVTESGRGTVLVRSVSRRIPEKWKYTANTSKYVYHYHLTTYVGVQNTTDRLRNDPHDSGTLAKKFHRIIVVTTATSLLRPDRKKCPLTIAT